MLCRWLAPRPVAGGLMATAQCRILVALTGGTGEMIAYPHTPTSVCFRKAKQ